MRRSCFTLVELLVVIATLAILIAISLPSLRSSRQQTKAVLCSSNVKQLTLRLLLYETENQTLPYGFNVEDDSKGNPIKPPGGYPGNSAFDRKGWWWFNFIEGFYKKSDNKRTVVQCPSKRLSNPNLQNNILCGNYGVNHSLCKSFDDIPSRREEFVGTPLCSEDISRPGETLLVVDSGYSLISWWHATDVPPIPPGKTREDTGYVPGLHINTDRYVWPGQELDAVDGRHPNKTVNVGFADSHVEKRKAESLFVEKTADGYRNKNPLWQPK